MKYTNIIINSTQPLSDLGSDSQGRQIGLVDDQAEVFAFFAVLGNNVGCLIKSLYDLNCISN